ncbi:MAG: hypothetical protein SV775_14820, partial [Thermodesulfobacteriota bacterium]|nr:hypothetical protein [Thermodesulfobacteriota bacterium]
MMHEEVKTSASGKRISMHPNETVIPAYPKKSRSHSIISKGQTILKFPHFLSLWKLSGKKLSN